MLVKERYDDSLLRRFSMDHRLRTRTDEDHTLIAGGRRGHVFQYSSDRLGVLVMPAKPAIWARQRKALIAAGCTVVQDGDAEGTASFDLGDPKQVAAALKAADVRRKR